MEQTTEKLILTNLEALTKHIRNQTKALNAFAETVQKEPESTENGFGVFVKDRVIGGWASTLIGGLAGGFLIYSGITKNNTDNIILGLSLFGFGVSQK